MFLILNKGGVLIDVERSRLNQSSGEVEAKAIFVGLNLVSDTRVLNLVVESDLKS